MSSWKVRLNQIGEKKEVEKGAFLFCDEDPYIGVYYVVSGELCVSRLGSKGQQLEMLRILPGNMVGLPPLFLTIKSYPAFCHALINSQVIFIKKADFLKELDINTKLYKAVTTQFAYQFMYLSQRLEILNLKTPEQRLVMYMISKCAKNHPGCLELQTKKVEVARHLAMAPETLSRVLNKLQRENIIKVDNKKIYIKDSVSLRKKLFS
ncbi:Crp/Fnr family transcriptional regulator [Candidatus Margulisiibacteriota bacterium]